jgi:adenylate kinase family enzyme
LVVERESHGPQDYCYEILTPNQALVSNPHRVIVAGTSGSGKTHLAARIGLALQIPYIEIDALHHGPGWNKRSTFESEVEQIAKTPQWVTEWQYSSVLSLLAKRANLLLWLDLSRTRVMSQVIERTLFRFLRRERLWNGNVEPPSWTIFRDRDHIICWAWRTHGETRSRVIALAGERPDLTIVRLGDRADVERWVAGPLAALARTI